MDLLSSIELPHWLMIGGALLIAIGFLGFAFTRNKQVATNPDSERLKRICAALHFLHSPTAHTAVLHLFARETLTQPTAPERSSNRTESIIESPLTCPRAGPNVAHMGLDSVFGGVR